MCPQPPQNVTQTITEARGGRESDEKAVAKFASIKILAYFCNMTSERFNAILPLKVTSIIKVMQNDGVDTDEAIKQLYGSRLYASLEQEETKMWWYSPSLLYDLLKEELATGSFTYPDN